MLHRSERFEFNVIGFLVFYDAYLNRHRKPRRGISAGEHEPLKIVLIVQAIRISTQCQLKILHLLTILGLMSELKSSNV